MKSDKELADKHRGHPMYQDAKGVWRFSDNGKPVSETWGDRPCGLCGREGTSNYGFPDPCLGMLPGVTNACCGHGNPKEAYMCFESGVVIRGFTVATPPTESED